ncbi:hypothetical protein ACMAY7_06235 [Rhodobacteraceae bacterium nBUS_24]
MMQIGPVSFAWIALALFIAILSLVALRLGARTTTLSETDIIDHYSALYLENESAEGRPAQLTDCYALAGSAFWQRIEIICQPAVAAPYRYVVGYWGQLLHFKRSLPNDLIPKA